MTQLQNQRKITLSHVCVCVNAVRTTLQFTLVTHGHLFRVRLGATKGTNIPIITHKILIIRVTMMLHATKRGIKDCPGFLNSTGRLGPKRGRKCYVTPAFSGVPKQQGTKSEVKTYARGHHDAPSIKAWIQRCPGFLNSTGRLGPKRGRKCYVTPAFSGVPKQRGTKIRSQNVR